MKHIAITGSFASGKSFVLKCLKSMGYKVFSCDDYVRKLYEDKKLQKLVENSIKNLDQFDKKKLAIIIYNDNNARKKLEAIIHPMVRSGIEDFAQKNLNEQVIFSEVPLLFESGFDKYFSQTICVYCLEKTRLKRSELRRIEDNDFFEKLKKIQLPQEEKQKLADFTINSEADLFEVKQSLQNIIEKI